MNQMKSFTEKYSNFVLNNSKLLTSLLVIVSLFFAVQLLWIKVNPSLFLLDKTHEGRIHMDRARDIYSGSGEQILVGVVTDKDSIFNVASLEQVSALSKAFATLNLVTEKDTEALQALATDQQSSAQIDAILEHGVNEDDKFKLSKLLEHVRATQPQQLDTIHYLEGLLVRAAPIVRIRSIANVENIQLKDEFLDIHDLMETVPKNVEEARKLEQEAYENKLFIDSLISADRKSTMIQIELLIDEEDSYNLQKFYGKVVDVLNNTDSADSFHIGGTATYMAAITQIVEQDNNKFFPFVVAVIALLLFISFRSWQGIWLPLSIAIVTLIWTMGVVSLLGFKLNIITNMIPVFLISIAVADAIHFLTAYDKYKQSYDQTVSVVKSLDHLMLPMLLTTITTFFGFFALSSSNLSFIREFGLFVAIGVVFAFILTVTMLPLILPRLKSNQAQAKATSKGLLNVVEKFGAKANKLSTSKPWLVLLALVVLIGTMGTLGSKVVVDNENIASFSDSTRVRQDNDALNAHFGGTIPVSIWFESEQKEILKTPEMAAFVRDIQAHISAHEHVGYTLSYVDYLDRIHDVIADDGQSTLPESATQELISQYFLLYEFGQGTEILDVIDYDYMNTRIIALSHTDKGTVWQDIIKSVSAYAEGKLPSGVTMHVIGTGELQASNIPEIINSQISSFVISVALISILMVILFRSFVLGFIGIAPLISTIAMLAGIMALLDIPLDIGTSMICGICFGVGIDYSIHFISVYKRNFAELNEDVNSALAQTMQTVCRPILVNSLTLSCGFFMLYFSDYAAIRNLGVLVAMSMILSAVISLFMLPTLIRLTNRGLPSEVIEGAQGSKV
ncbi:efflux RND transporter permease subunit [Pseudoalteromonas byunsanensis]|uniref:SSD domain-containing protein n=1 Tax=Pseudoalteromonas byunsanensis TaxID=327939 RepID=A0A1S1N9G4_9GAMM|nr:efflux RND transporter permease subunit [Pseudoalteromonas byunsanensis]OHU96003.1 hypothetical protein BIW53_09385 [Pseudoalteromonas byunsanensis]